MKSCLTTSLTICVRIGSRKLLVPTKGLLMCQTFRIIGIRIRLSVYRRIYLYIESHAAGRFVRFVADAGGIVLDYRREPGLYLLAIIPSSWMMMMIVLRLRTCILLPFVYKSGLRGRDVVSHHRTVLVPTLRAAFTGRTYIFVSPRAWALPCRVVTSKAPL